MRREVSPATMISCLEGLVDTGQLTSFQENFIQDMAKQAQDKAAQQGFTLRQIDYLEQLYHNYFA